MGGCVADDSVIGGLEQFKWDQDESIRYEVALETIGEAVAHYTALIDRAEASGDQAGAERLAAEQAACITDRNQLRATDHEQVARVLAEYRELIGRLADQLR